MEIRNAEDNGNSAHTMLYYVASPRNLGNMQSAYARTWTLRMGLTVPDPNATYTDVTSDGDVIISGAHTDQQIVFTCPTVPAIDNITECSVSHSNSFFQCILKKCVNMYSLYVC